MKLLMIIWSVLIEDAQKLRAENEKLRNELDCQSHGICSNKGHGINSTCRYCADEEIERLKKEIALIETDWPLTENKKLKFQLNSAKKLLRYLLNRVNVVTAYHRHGNTVSADRLDDLANRQIEVEEILKELGE